MIVKKTPKLRLVTVGNVQEEVLQKALLPVQHFVEVVQGPPHKADLIVACQAQAPTLREECSCPVILCRGDGNHQIPDSTEGSQLPDFVLHLFRQRVSPRPDLAF